MLKDFNDEKVRKEIREIFKEGNDDESDLNKTVENILGVTQYSYKSITSYINAPRFTLQDTIAITKYQKTKFQIINDDTIYFIRIGSTYGNNGIGDDYSIMLEINEFIDLDEELGYRNMNKWTEKLLEARVETIEDVKRYLAAFFDVDIETLKIELVDPIYNVVVHKITGFPMYRFNCGTDKFIVTIEKDYIDDYEIQIRKNTKDHQVMSLTGVKKGKFFKTVLLKRLNDWFKEYYDGYKGRVKFSWGKNINMD